MSVLSHRASPVLPLVILLLAHACMLGWSARRHSPTHLEVFHLPAGLSHCCLGRFDLDRVNPPLVRIVAALPTLLMSPRTDWGGYATDPLRRSEYGVGIDFFSANGSRSLWFVTMGRWACMPFSLLGAYICFRWARDLYGQLAGLAACTLWCFSPSILGHASLLTPDAHAAAMGVAACYAFWLWLRRCEWRGAFVTGLVLGLAELTKFTLIALYPLWLLTWIGYRVPEPHRVTARGWFREGGMLVVMMALSVCVINVGYGFEGSFQRLAEYHFQSRVMIGCEHLDHRAEEGGNRFVDSWLGLLPVPIPRNYLQGIDTQKLEFETGTWSFLRSQWRRGGWWYFYVYALAVKVPLGTWALVLLAVLSSFLCRKYSALWRDEMVLLMPVAAILVLASWQSGIGVHSRYLLPIMPFTFIWISKVARATDLRHWMTVLVAGTALLWAVGSSLWHYPHSLSYFNELTGGPAVGYRHLAKDNSSWGQDLLYLREWLHEHAEAYPLHLASCGPLDPRLCGIEFSLPPLGPTYRDVGADLPERYPVPLPGWYAIDVSFLAGNNPLSAADGNGGWENPRNCLCYFQQSEPVAMAGYSIYIYHVTLDEANRVRRELGLPGLGDERKRGERVDVSETTALDQ